MVLGSQWITLFSSHLYQERVLSRHIAHARTVPATLGSSVPESSQPQEVIKRRKKDKTRTNNGGIYLFPSSNVDAIPISGPMANLIKTTFL